MMPPPPGFDSTIDTVLQKIDLRAKRVLITGSSAGLGLETARACVARGADVVGGVQNLDKARSATASWNDAARGSIDHVTLDLASLTAVRKASDILLERGDPFDVVIANAGIMACPQGLTEDGFERQFGINHLGHFVFVNRLRPLIRPGGRIVCLSSNAHRTAELDFEDVNFAGTRYNEWLAYGRSKTANALFAAELDRRWQDEGIRAASVHPGGIMTELDRHLPAGAIAELVAVMDDRLVAEGKEPLKWKTIPQGAATTAWAAFVASGDKIGGRYCEDCSIAEIDDEADKMSGVRSYIYDADLGARLWGASESLVGETY